MTQAARIEFCDLKAQYRALKPEIDARIQRVLDHAQFIMGPEVGELEERLAGYTGTKYCITCSSGTDALLLSLMALGIGPGDEVITTPFTFVATAEVVVLAGATPVFVDVERDTCNIDPNQIERAITPRTRAIMPVSLYGQPADMDEINAIAGRHGIAVIEDAAQSFGADYKGRKSCNLSTIGCTSFFPSKPLGCYGDGGAALTSDDKLAQAMRELRVHGQSRRYYHTRVGLGARMDSIQCAVVLAKLDRFQRELAMRQAVAHRYDALLATRAPALGRLVVRPDRSSVFAQYTVVSRDREGLQKRLQAAAIPTAVHYPVPLHRQPAYARFAAGDAFPAADDLAARVISLPMHADLDESTQARIVDAVASALVG